MGNVLGMIAGAALGPIYGMATQRSNDRRQIEQQEKLLEQQSRWDKDMANFNQELQYQMWQRTNYGPQVEQMKKAGLNPALLYGMGGGGGTTTGSAGGSVNASKAPVGGGEQMAGLGMALQLGLMKAQKENIEADTENKKMNTLKTDQEQYGKQLENIFTEWMHGLPQAQGTNLDESMAGKKAKIDLKFLEDENLRKELMNNQVLQEITAKINLMAQQGLKENEIFKNLQKEGKLLDAEIEFNQLDIKDNPGKFLWHVIKTVLGQVKAR